MSTPPLKLQYYKIAFMRIRRGNYRGRVINAKPIFLISILELISKGLLKDNRIYYSSMLQEEFCKQHSIFDPLIPTTPLYKPFLHLSQEVEAFWHLQYNSPCEKIVFSDLFIRDHVNYASFDNALWDLLQDDESRALLKNVLIQTFLTEK